MSKIINFGDYRKNDRIENTPTIGISNPTTKRELCDTDIDTIIVRSDITDNEWDKILVTYEDKGYYVDSPNVNAMPEGLFTDKCMCIAMAFNGDMVLLKADGTSLEWKGDDL